MVERALDEHCHNRCWTLTAAPFLVAGFWQKRGATKASWIRKCQENEKLDWFFWPLTFPHGKLGQ
ncbi:hypothetical protein LCGC14_1798260 [marine sediment metagenome]|uniref:Uncharacterized protein n=1 Tax=marine sediment metagenome TaxID=412755 RepID=A0A0F9JPY8_9ZZZZ